MSMWIWAFEYDYMSHSYQRQDFSWAGNWEIWMNMPICCLAHWALEIMPKNEVRGPKAVFKMVQMGSLPIIEWYCQVCSSVGNTCPLNRRDIQLAKLDQFIVSMGSTIECLNKGMLDSRRLVFGGGNVYKQRWVGMSLLYLLWWPNGQFWLGTPFSLVNFNFVAPTWPRQLVMKRP